MPIVLGHRLKPRNLRLVRGHSLGRAVGLFPMIGQGGANVFNLAGHSDAVINGDVTRAPGPWGNSSHFDQAGTPSYLSVPVDAAMDIQDSVTVAARFKLDGTGPNPDLGGLVDKTVGGATNAQYQIFAFGGKFFFRINNNLVGLTDLPSATTLVAGTWYTGVGTYDGTTQALYLQSPGSLEILTSTFASGPLNGGAGELLMGYLGSGLFPFQGSMDFAGIWPYAMTPGQVAELLADPFAMLRPDSPSRIASSFGGLVAPAGDPQTLVALGGGFALGEGLCV